MLPPQLGYFSSPNMPKGPLSQAPISCHSVLKSCCQLAPWTDALGEALLTQPCPLSPLTGTGADAPWSPRPLLPLLFSLFQVTQFLLDQSFVMDEEGLYDASLKIEPKLPT